jgi:hypothetical protein
MASIVLLAVDMIRLIRPLVAGQQPTAPAADASAPRGSRSGLPGGGGRARPVHCDC